MQIEVTEKEALNIYASRYINRYNKSSWAAFIISFIVVCGVYWFFNWLTNGSILSATAIVLILPLIYFIAKLSHNAGKYAKSKLVKK